METSDKITLAVTPTYTRKTALWHLITVSAVAVVWPAAEALELARARDFGTGFYVAVFALVVSLWATVWGITEVRGLRDSITKETRTFTDTAEAVAFMKETLGLTDAELRVELEKQLAKVSA